MSSMIKKKGALSFKPRAPVRRLDGAPQSRTSSARPSIEPSFEPSSSTPPTTSAPAPDTATLQRVSDETRTQEVQEAVPAQLALHTQPVPASQNTPNRPAFTGRAEVQSTPTSTVAASLTAIVDAGDASVQSAEQPDTTVPTLSDETPHVNQNEQVVAASPEGQSRMYLDETTATFDVVESVYPPLPDLETTLRTTVTDISAMEVGQLNRVTRIVPEADLSALGAGQSNQGTQIVAVAPLNPDGTSGEPILHGRKPGNRHSKKRRLLDDKEPDIRPTIEVQIHKPRRQPAKEPRPPRNPDDPPRKRNKRVSTPEDAEKQEVDHSTLKMADLCKDLGIGKRFSKADEINKRESEKRIKRQMAKLHPELFESTGSPPAAEPEVGTASGPQMRIVDGQIVIDDTSLVVDRHREAAAAAPEMEEVMEDEFSRVVTSGTHMRRENNLYWSKIETDKFYDGLRMFGTDFEMISKMFPSRNRRQVKLKFNKEEREYPKKVNSALLGERVAIDLEEYQSHTGLEYEDVSTIEEKQKAIEAEHEAERARMEEAAAEATAQKKADIQSQASLAPRLRPDVPASGTDSAKENDTEMAPAAVEGGRAISSKGKKKAPAKRKKRNLHSTRGGGEEVVVLGTIDGAQV